MPLTTRQKISVRIAGALYLGYLLLTIAIARSWRAWVAMAAAFVFLHAAAWYLELKGTKNAESD